MTRPPVPFVAAAPAEDAAEVCAAIDRVVASGWYVLGREVAAFEDEFAAMSGVRHAVGVGNGTDALTLILRALGIGPGDDVVTTPLSAAYTALAVMAAGARPVFADIDPARLTIDPAAIEPALTPATRAIIPVHLYGQAADMTAIMRIASRHNLAVVEDCCQAHLATAGGCAVGSIGTAGAFSFYPTKNLAALGDGGAVVTGDAALADRVRLLRNGGQTDRYRHAEPGVNSRLDELQAAILRARLPYLRGWTARRRALAAVYRRELAGGSVAVPAEFDPGHVYHLFVVRSRRRDALQQMLAGRGVETLVHYPVPIPLQPALAKTRPMPCPIAVAACSELLSLPLRPGLADSDAIEIAAAVRGWQDGLQEMD